MKLLLIALITQMLTWGDRPLQWSDFQGMPTDPNLTASSAIEMMLVRQKSAHTTHYLVKVVFHKERSWTTTKNPYILQHEQSHFNLAEVYARILRYRIHNLDNYKEICRIYDQTVEEWSKADDLYDLRTGNSQNREEQEKWDKDILKQLSQVKAYE